MDRILRDLTTRGKEEGLTGFEQVKRIYLEPSSLALHGCLSSTMKLVRHIAREKFNSQINDMYAEIIDDQNTSQFDLVEMKIA